MVADNGPLSNCRCLQCICDQFEVFVMDKKMCLIASENSPILMYHVCLEMFNIA